jgi:hypothetical protein
MPRVLREIVRATLDRDAEIQVVTELSAGAPVFEAIQTLDADFVITGPAALHEQDVGGQLLEQDDRIRVLAVRNDGGRSVIWEQLGELSPEDLIAVIKGAPEATAASRDC